MRGRPHLETKTSASSDIYILYSVVNSVCVKIAALSILQYVAWEGEVGAGVVIANHPSFFEGRF